jgi:hypothetical protein
VGVVLRLPAVAVAFPETHHVNDYDYVPLNERQWG